MKTENFSDILARRLKSRGLDRAVLGAWVCATADKVSAELALSGESKGEYKAISFKNGILKIQVSSGARASLIKMKEQDYISKINSELKRELVQKLRFEID